MQIVKGRTTTLLHHTHYIIELSAENILRVDYVSMLRIKFLESHKNLEIDKQTTLLDVRH